MNAIDGKKFRRVVQAVGAVLVQNMDAKGREFIERCNDVLQGSTVARRWWNSLDPEDQLLLFYEACNRVRTELGQIKNRRRKSVAL
jgi:hypothetical protein